MTHGGGKFMSSEEWRKAHIPNYCNDLNAMHEAENILDYDNLREMEKNILFIFAIIPLRATAAQHAEAFLKTLGKWEDAK